MSELLFDRPFNPMDVTNHCQPCLLASVELVRKDQRVLEKVASIKTAFLTQNDCLCHGDFSPDNILVSSSQFRVRACWNVDLVTIHLVRTCKRLKSTEERPR